MTTLSPPAASRSALLTEARHIAQEPFTPYRLFWLFTLAAVLGDLIETVFWLLTRGQLTSRSSLVWGQFSLVWGLGALLLTLLLRPLASRSALTLFAAGSLLGGIFEYICSWVQEEVFGVVFWYYGHLPFNLNARINLGFCLLWGLVSVAWIRTVYPLLCLFIETRLRPRAKHLTTVLAVFLVFSALLSAAALTRMEQRREGIPAAGPVSVWLDNAFSDQWMSHRYPTMHPPEYYS